MTRFACIPTLAGFVAVGQSVMGWVGWPEPHSAPLQCNAQCNRTGRCEAQSVAWKRWGWQGGAG